MSDYNINKMDFKQLRNEVQLLRDELAIMKRKYEDILYNLDDDNFSSQFIKEKGDMKTAIEQTEEAITMQAEKIDENKEGLATLNITANGISSAVSSVFKEITIVTKKADMTDESKIYSLGGYNYHYNNITKDWEKIDGNSIASSFVQTADGFELAGDVSISGDAIVGGTIRGSTLQTFMSSEKSGYGTYAELNAENGSLDLYYQADIGDENRPNDEKEHRFSIYQSGGTTYIENINSTLMIGNYANEITHAENKTFPIGTWDFSHCTLQNLASVVAKFA